MKITIVTVCFNSAKYIAGAIQSVVMQNYPDIEYIVIDGGSTDGTVDIVKSYGDKITRFISEPDLGIYDAMNKGLRLATGDVIGILNSDDIFFDNNVLANVANTFVADNCDCLFGDLVYVAPYDTSKVIRYWRTSKMPLAGFSNGWHPPHPSFYAKKSVYERCGYFKDNYNFSADFEIMMRILQVNQHSYSYLAVPMVRMRLGGKTSKNLKNIYLGNLECLKAFKENGLSKSPFYLFLRILMKLNQFKRIV